MELDKEHKKARDSLFYDTNRTIGICEVLRLICDEVYDMPKNEKIIELLIEATVMAKKINNRLGYYKRTYNDSTGHGGSSLKRASGVVKRRDMRIKRKNG